MVYRIFVMIAAVLVFLLLIWLSVSAGHGRRVRLGRNSHCYICLEVRGREPKLEQSVRELIWFMDVSGLYAGIIIQGIMLDPETRTAAFALAEYHKCITFIEDGEAPWIKIRNC